MLESRALIAATLGALLWACPTPARAGPEREVGLEAQGVDPWASLHNSQGLDVRDELGRPVSRRLVERQMKAAQAAAAADGAYASRLPQARGMVLWIELLSAFSASLIPRLPFLPKALQWGLAPAARPAPRTLFALLFLAMAAAGAKSAALSARACPLRALSRAPAVLRC